MVIFLILRMVRGFTWTSQICTCGHCSYSSPQNGSNYLQNLQKYFLCKLFFTVWVMHCWYLLNMNIMQLHHQNICKGMNQRSIGSLNMLHQRPTCPIGDWHAPSETNMPYQRLTCLWRPIRDQQAYGVLSEF